MSYSTYSTLNVIEQELKTLPREVHNEEATKRNLEYVKDLAKRNIPTLLIKEILNNENLLKIISARSYEHVNHFDKIVLIDNNNDASGFRLTLHSWNCNYSKEVAKEELIHNHRFSFWSHIYRGNLLSENFTEAETFSIERKLFNRYVYRPSATGNIHTCTYDKKAQLIKLESPCVKQGETYYLNFKTTHRVVLPKSKENVCTFVLRGPREREYTNTYNTFYPDRGVESNVPMMTMAQLKDKLIAILGE